ncbi:hypothetical protein NFI96_030327 [Prochilodus magdalenae]|nr:hypothetical protein NFI96_030327 [Prochilodus magdalenae]
MASSRGALVTVGQGGCATFLCQPLDVVKTRLMNSKGEYRGVVHCLTETAKLGPLAFYKEGMFKCLNESVYANPVLFPVGVPERLPAFLSQCWELQHHQVPQKTGSVDAWPQTLSSSPEDTGSLILVLKALPDSPENTDRLPPVTESVVSPRAAPVPV